MFLVCNSTVNKRINCGFVHQFCRLFCDVAPWKLVEKVRCNLGANSIKHCRFRLSKGVQGAAKKYPYCKKTLRRYFLSHQVVLAQYFGTVYLQLAINASAVMLNSVKHRRSDVFTSKCGKSPDRPSCTQCHS